MADSDSQTADASGEIIVTCFHSDGRVTVDGLDGLSPDIGDDALVWAEATGAGPDAVDEVARRLSLSAPLAQRLRDDSGCPWVDSDGDQYAACAMAAEHLGELEFRGVPLLIAAGRNFVVTLHPRRLAFLEVLREREGRRSRVGVLSADSFVASLLGWHLDTYFAAASDFERSVERLEEAVLRDHTRESVEELRHLRRGASRLRRMLAPHRALFTAMARPDFRPDADPASAAHFRHLGEQFERAMDVIENARELMLGSFELFSNQVALQTNATMRVLTFITVIIGAQTVIAGVLGMNFDAPFFKTQGLGFWTAVGGMTVVAAVAAWLGSRRGWF